MKKDELLSKEALIEAFSRDIYFSESTKAAIRSVIHTQPSVEAEVVIHCKDCDWGRKDDEGGCICVNPKCTKSFYGCPVLLEHFCSYGEPKEG